jgi:DNA oxidative demethylase
MMVLSANQPGAPIIQWLAAGAAIVKGLASTVAAQLVADIDAVQSISPFRHLTMANGSPMSVAMTNCGDVGWISTPSGYRYSRIDPETGHSWPAMPDAFRELAVRAAVLIGFEDFDPNVCIVNRYVAGAELRTHQDRDDAKNGHPVVSVSLGLPATFYFGNQGPGRKPIGICLENGDVAVWGGPSRMAYHGIAPIEPGIHALTGGVRFNLTFRTARLPR